MGITMTNIILVVAFVTEAAFATYCIITKSNQRRARNFMRIGALAAFILLTLVSAIQWSFRWYLLATLLLVWAALSAWALIRKTTDKKEYRTGRILGRAIGTLALVFLALIPLLIFPQNKLLPMTGPHPVATVNYTYTDPSRIETFTNTGANREVNVEFWHPADGGGPYPLVVFSHGAFGIKASNTSTFMDLASNGYVVCSIDHPYHSFITVDADGHRTRVDPSFLQAVIDLNKGKYDEETGYRLHQKWMALRVADIKLVLDSILSQVKDSSSSGVYRLIDLGKIGLMGHSLGGESAAQVARERSDISAVVNLDSNLLGEYLDYVDGKYMMNDTAYPVPLLNILTSTTLQMFDAIPDANSVVAVKRIAATSPKVYEVDLEGTGHMSVTDLPLISPFLVSMISSAVPKSGGREVTPYATVEKMNAIVLKFFNAYLKGEGSFTAAGTY
jgi:predicted dienelactone hydrolase